jgi:hypothetical protein
MKRTLRRTIRRKAFRDLVSVDFSEIERRALAAMLSKDDEDLGRAGLEQLIDIDRDQAEQCENMEDNEHAAGFPGDLPGHGPLADPEDS